MTYLTHLCSSRAVPTLPSLSRDEGRPSRDLARRVSTSVLGFARHERPFKRPFKSLTAVLGIAIALFATPASAAPAVDPATLAAARRLIAASDMENQLRLVLPQIIDAAMKQARSTFKDDTLPKELDAKLQSLLRQHVTSIADVFGPDMQAKMAEVYARHFSTADLNHIADMLADPAMVRFREQTPATMQDIMPVIMEAMAPKQAAFRAEIMKTIVDWIRDHPNDKALLAKPLAT